MKRILYTVLILLAAWSCTRTAVPGAIRLQASYEDMDADTRSNVSDHGSFVWNDWDILSVLTSEGQFADFQITSGAGSKTAGFAGSLPEGVSMGDLAVYPAGEHSLSGNTLSVHYPDTYTYPADTTDSCPVMVARMADNKAPFKHVGGLMRIRYKNVPVKATHLVLTFHKQVVTGDFPLDLSEEEPVAVMSAGTSQVVINFTSPTSPTNTRHFYLPLPTGELTDMDLEFRDADDALIPGTQYSSHSTKTVTRKRLLKMPGLVLTVINAGIE